MGGTRADKDEVRIDNRFALFDLDGGMAEDGKEIWSLIESEVDGLVLEVLAENGKAVQYGDSLFKIQTS